MICIGTSIWGWVGESAFRAVRAARPRGRSLAKARRRTVGPARAPLQLLGDRRPRAAPASPGRATGPRRDASPAGQRRPHRRGPRARPSPITPLIGHNQRGTQATPMQPKAGRPTEPRDPNPPHRRTDKTRPGQLGRSSHLDQGPVPPERRPAPNTPRQISRGSRRPGRPPNKPAQPGRRMGPGSPCEPRRRPTRPPEAPDPPRSPVAAPQTPWRPAGAPWAPEPPSQAAEAPDDRCRRSSSHCTGVRRARAQQPAANE